MLPQNPPPPQTSSFPPASNTGAAAAGRAQPGSTRCFTTGGCGLVTPRGNATRSKLPGREGLPLLRARSSPPRRARAPQCRGDAAPWGAGGCEGRGGRANPRDGGCGAAAPPPSPSILAAGPVTAGAGKRSQQKPARRKVMPQVLYLPSGEPNPEPRRAPGRQGQCPPRAGWQAHLRGAAGPSFPPACPSG